MWEIRKNIYYDNDLGPVRVHSQSSPWDLAGVKRQKYILSLGQSVN